MSTPREPEGTVLRASGHTILTEKALEYVTWDWQPFDEVLLRLARLVSPGKALRKAEREYEASVVASEARRQRRMAEDPNFKPTGPKPRPTRDQFIRRGQREFARDTLANYLESGRFEIDEIDDVKMVRLKERRTDGTQIRPASESYVEVDGAFWHRAMEIVVVGASWAGHPDVDPVYVSVPVEQVQEPEPTVDDEPCAQWEGCVLADGHDGRCHDEEGDARPLPISYLGDRRLSS